MALSDEPSNLTGPPDDDHPLPDLSPTTDLSHLDDDLSTPNSDRDQRNASSPNMTQDVPSQQANDIEHVQHEPENDDDFQHDAPYVNVSMVIDKNERPVDDDIYQVMREHQMGAAVMFVPDLCPEWRKGPTSQRPLTSQHVQDLYNQMADKIRRTEFADRLRVSCTGAEYEQCLQYTCKMYDQWKDNGLCEHSYTVPQLRASLTAMITRTLPIELTPMLVWDPQLPTKPQLDVGQHRRAAFLDRFNARAQHQAIYPVNKSDIGWVVDIANMDTLDDRYYRLIRSNQHDVYKPDSEGDIMLALDNVIDQFFVMEQSGISKKGTDKLGRFIKFVTQELGRSIPSPKRYQQVVVDQVWRAQAVKYVGYAFGRQHFRIHHFATASGQFLNEFWVGHFDTQYKKMQGCFGENRKKIREEDLRLIRVVGKPCNSTSDLRILFFPTITDSNKGKLAVEAKWFTNAEFARFQLQVPHLVDGFARKHRRPGFLSNLADADYIQTFQRLQKIGYVVPDPSTLAKEISRVANVMTALVKHMVFWVDPTWTPPKNNQGDLRSQTCLISVLTQCYRPSPPSNINVDFPTPAQVQAAENEILKSKRTIVHTLSDLQHFIHDTSKEWTGLAPGTLEVPAEMIGSALSTTQRQAYRDRFYYEPWSSFLTLVIEQLGSQQFTGVMKPWVTNAHLHDNEPVMGPLRAQASEFYRGPIQIRFGDIQVDKGRYSHTKRVTEAIERAIRVEEARTAAMIIQDLDVVQERCSAHTRNTHRRTDPEDLSDDELGTRGTSVLKLGLSMSELRLQVPAILRESVVQLQDYGITVPADDAKMTLKELPPAAVLDETAKILVSDDSDYEPPKRQTSQSTPRKNRKPAQPPATMVDPPRPRLTSDDDAEDELATQPNPKKRRKGENSPIKVDDEDIPMRNKRQTKQPRGRRPKK